MTLSSIYLMTRDAENHFICLLAIIGEMYVQSFVLFLIELFGVFSLLSCRSSLCILDFNPLSEV